MAETNGNPAIVVHATRIFTAPELYPPRNFAAYGIVAFRSRATPDDINRHMMICHAYVASLAHTSELDISLSQQIVTTWPVQDIATARQLNKIPRNPVCESAVRHYGLILAQDSIQHAELAGETLNGVGPYLLAWAPSTDKGKPNTLVLVGDLSTVTTSEQAINVFKFWKSEIEKDPPLWSDGWDLNRLQLKIQQWVDLYGERLFSMLVN